MLNMPPRVLSLSEFFTCIGLKTFRLRRPTGDWTWKLYSRQSYRTLLLLREPFEELSYPFDDPASRFTRSDVPPIACATLHHPYNERSRRTVRRTRAGRSGTAQTTARGAFAGSVRMAVRTIRCGPWVERSGGSLIFAPRLLSEFPEARVVHVYRDGRETALSMSRHYPFRLYPATMKKLRPRVTDVEVLVSGVKRWSKINPWLELLLPLLVKPERLPFDKLTITDFAAYWSALIGLAHEMLGLEDEAWIRKASAIPRQTPSKFAKLSVAEQDAIIEACRLGLERLGYSP